MLHRFKRVGPVTIEIWGNSGIKYSFRNSCVFLSFGSGLLVRSSYQDTKSELLGRVKFRSCTTSASPDSLPPLCELQCLQSVSFYLIYLKQVEVVLFFCTFH